MKNQEAHIIKTSKIKHRPEDVKVNVDMVDLDTSKQVSPTNPHVSEVTPQILGIINSFSKVQASKFKFWTSKFQSSKF